MTLTNVTTAHVEGGSFGSVLDTEGITVSIDNSSDIGIFCTTVNDKVTVRDSSLLWINLGAGEDNLVIDGASTMAAFGDAGADRVTVRSGTDILIYLGDGNDQAEVFGGSLIRIIGEAATISSWSATQQYSTGRRRWCGSIRIDRWTRHHRAW